MGYRLEKFSAGSLDKGLSIRSSEFQADLTLGDDTYNMTSGIYDGIGPRYGMAIIPGHADQVVQTGHWPGLAAAELSSNITGGYVNRKRVLGVMPLKTRTLFATTPVNTFVWFITQKNGSAQEYIDCLMSVDYISANPSSLVSDGFPLGTSGLDVSPTLYGSYILTDPLVSDATNKTGPRNAAQSYTSSKYYCSMTSLTVSGADIPMRWTIGKAFSTGDASHAPSVAQDRTTNMTGPGATTTPILGGVPSEFNLGTYKSGQRTATIYSLAVDGNDLGITPYVRSFTPSSSIFQSDATESVVPTVTIDGTVNTGVAPYGSVKMALIDDPDCKQRSGYQAVFAACDKPVGFLFQDAYSGTGAFKGQLCDLTQHAYAPPVVGNTGSTIPYKEEGAQVPCCFMNWGNFVRGTAMTSASWSGVTYLGALGAANSGILRANTVYEFTYSVYNKRLGFETNVGRPVKIQTGASDFVALQLWDPTAGIGSKKATQYADLVSNLVTMPFAFGTFQQFGYQSSSQFLNWYQYRFYYRQEGTTEWLPALFIDAAQWWFYPFKKPIYACTAPVASTVGGQPGGFNDYSPLPNDEYTCVTTYKNRVFWVSPKALLYSMKNNAFCYPGRNSTAATGGEFKGALVHNYPGQAQQDSRLIVFGTDNIYVGRFTGDLQQVNVQVSATASGVFDLEGSDFVLDPWTTSTAFSNRSACIGEGILYWWGPQGFFRDDGVQTPTKLSLNLEPDVFEYYDPNLTDQIHAHYDATSKEITWFYPPKVADGFATHSMVYNTVSGTFKPGKFEGFVDWSQNLTIASNIKTAGKRALVGVRASSAATIQRAYFFDLRNRAGDMYPTADMVVKLVQTPATGQRRLTLAPGYDAAKFATIAVGDYIAIQQANDYTALSTADDMVAKVIALGTGTIDITLPTGASMATLANLIQSWLFFPIWHKAAASRGINGIPWKATTTYWMPNGINGYWQWLFVYLLAKVNLWFSNEDQTFSLGYRSPTSVATLTDTLTLVNNSDGACQIYHPLAIGGENAEGQALKFTISGDHIGNEWVLQYLEAHNTPISGDNLRRFEG